MLVSGEGWGEKAVCQLHKREGRVLKSCAHALLFSPRPRPKHGSHLFMQESSPCLDRRLTRSGLALESRSEPLLTGKEEKGDGIRGG